MPWKRSSPDAPLLGPWLQGDDVIVEAKYPNAASREASRSKVTEKVLTGAELWAEQRARWLGREVPELSNPSSEEASDDEADADADADAEPLGITEGERLHLRYVILTVAAPYPALRRSVPLSAAVKTAADLWSDERMLDPTPAMRIAAATKAGSQELLEQAAAGAADLGRRVTKWGQDVAALATPRGPGEQGGDSFSLADWGRNVVAIATPRLTLIPNSETAPKPVSVPVKPVPGRSAGGLCSLGFWDRKEPGDSRQCGGDGCSLLRGRYGFGEGLSFQACGIIGRKGAKKPAQNLEAAFEE